MDYEKKYNEALNWMRELYPGLHGATKEDAEHYFPELRESEDEKTRKRLIDFISNIKTISESGRNSLAIRKDDAEMCDAFLLYLEKKKDHFRDDTKMVEKQDYSGLNDLERAIHRGFLSAGVENVPVTIIKETANECKRTQTIANENANAEWSEKDEDIRDTIIYVLKRLGGDIANVNPAYKEEIGWLKSLRPQPHWKPSEEQMNCLCAAVDRAIRKHNESVGGYKPARVLKSLYEQLQRLEEQEEPEYYQHFDPDC